MKQSKDYKISVVLFITALVFYGTSIATSLIPNFDYSIDKIFMYLGFVCYSFGLVFLKKSEKNDSDK